MKQGHLGGIINAKNFEGMQKPRRINDISPFSVPCLCLLRNYLGDTRRRIPEVNSRGMPWASEWKFYITSTQARDSSCDIDGFNREEITKNFHNMSSCTLSLLFLPFFLSFLLFSPFVYSRLSFRLLSPDTETFHHYSQKEFPLGKNSWKSAFRKNA